LDGDRQVFNKGSQS